MPFVSRVRWVHLVLCTMPLLCGNAWAQWNPAGVEVAAPTNYAFFMKSIPDGNGGAIFVWEQWVGLASGSDDIYAAKVNAAGFRQWTAAGVPVCTASGDQTNPVAVSDGAGGAIIVWTDSRPSAIGHVYAQRLNAAGAPQWTANGVPLCTNPAAQYGPTLVSDGAGGAIVAWEDGRQGDYEEDVYAQRVSSSGARLWNAEGDPICTAAGRQGPPALVADGSGGAILTWEDVRGPVYAQRIDASGTAQWTPNGIALSTAAQSSPAIVPDGVGGAVIVGFSGSYGSGPVRGQRVNGSGMKQWGADGVTLTTSSADKFFPVATQDGTGGAIAVWEDWRSGEDLYSQHVNGAGSGQWASDFPVCVKPDLQDTPSIAPDAAGGAYISWYDEDGVVAGQRVSATGSPLWTVNGQPLATGAIGYDVVVVPDASGGAIFGWRDTRNGGYYRIDAQRLNSSGQVVGVGEERTATLDAVRAWPSPFSDRVNVAFDLPAAGPVSLHVYDIAGRRVRSEPAVPMDAGPRTLTWNGRDDAGAEVSEGIYYLRVSAPEFSESRQVVRLK